MARFEERLSAEQKKTIREKRNYELEAPPPKDGRAGPVTTDDPNFPHWSDPSGGESISGVSYREAKQDGSKSGVKNVLRLRRKWMREHPHTKKPLKG